MKEVNRVLKEIRLTEKATQQGSDLNQYVFEVYRDANRTEIASAVEIVFNVKVTKVNTINQKGKRKRIRAVRGKFRKNSDIKKAIVSLRKGDTIELI